MKTMDLHIENVGGIDESDLEFESGTTLITGRNASNKTSLLRALLFAFGEDEVPIRTGADLARVEMSLGDVTVERTATSQGRGYSVSGEPFVDDSEEKQLFSRFAGLLETNPLRTAVQTNTGFEDLLKEPMNIDSLEAKRADKLAQKRDLQSRLDELSGVDEELASVESDLETRRQELEELEEELETLYEELPEEEDEDLEKLRQQRTELVSERERLTAQIDDTEAAIERVNSTMAEVEEQLNGIDADRDTQQLRNRRAEIQEELEDIEERIDTLQSALTANRAMLETDMRDLFEYESGIEEDKYECWACGKQAQESAFESVVERIGELISDEKARKKEYRPEIEEIESELESAEKAKRERSRLEERIQSLRSKQQSRTDSLEKKREQLAEVEEKLARLDEEIREEKENRADDQSEVSQRIEETRVDAEAKRREIQRLESRTSELRERQEERTRVRDELETLNEEIQELTNRIENLETDLRTTFNDAMEELLDVLDFESVERVWLSGDFEIVVAREVDGTVGEDSVENLAESERGMIGLVLGLAGYLAYDVEEVAPVLILDSLGEFDAERTNRLIDYFSEHTEYLFAAVHPEQVEEGSDRQERLTVSQR
jgi:chromosome segregation ATPase